MGTEEFGWISWDSHFFLWSCTTTSPKDGRGREQRFESSTCCDLCGRGRRHIFRLSTGRRVDAQPGMEGTKEELQEVIAYLRPDLGIRVAAEGDFLCMILDIHEQFYVCTYI